MPQAIWFKQLSFQLRSTQSKYSCTTSMNDYGKESTGANHAKLWL